MHAVVTGLSGSGKTQLALNFVQDHLVEYDTILWIDANNAETIRSSFERCCCDLGLSDEDSQARIGIKALMQVVRRCLLDRSCEKPWLVVVDFADDLTLDVHTMLPHGQGGTIIIISQDQEASRLLDRARKPITVDAMDAHESVSLLQKTTGTENGDCNEQTLSLMTKVVGLVDRLPLGIELAGARIYNDIRYGSDVVGALRQYISDFERHANHILQNKDLARTTPDKKTVWTALNFAALRRIEADDPDTSPISLLILLSYLNFTHVQKEIFRLASHGLVLLRKEVAFGLPSWLENVLLQDTNGEWDDYFWGETVNQLHRYALVRPVKDDEWIGVTMHSLIARRAQHEPEAEEIEKMSTILMAAACFQAGEHTERSNFRRHLLLHLSRATQLLNESQFHPTDVHSWWSIITEAVSCVAQTFTRKEFYAKQIQPLLWMKIAVICTEEGRMLESERLVRAAVACYTAILGPRHHRTIEARNELTYVYQERGHSGKARVLGEETLRLARKGLGNDHKQTLQCLGHLSCTYQRLGCWEKAEELGKLHLEAVQTVSDVNDPCVAEAMSNLATTYGKLGRFTEAEPLERQVIAKLTEIAGADASPTVIAKGNLSTSLREQGKFDEAEYIQTGVVQLLNENLGPVHRYTLVNKGSLAAIYRGQGRLIEARDLALVTLQPMSEAVGHDHPSTLKLKENLVLIYRQMRQHKEADEMYESIAKAKARNRIKQNSIESCLNESMDEVNGNQGKKPRPFVCCCILM